VIRLIGLWLVGCALFVTPVAADEDLYDGSTAIKPLTVTAQPRHSAPPNTSATSSISATRRRAEPRPRLPAALPAIVVKPNRAPTPSLR
jgi:hypothetical protein